MTERRLSDDARDAIAAVLDDPNGFNVWDVTHDEMAAHVLAATLPSGLTIAQALDTLAEAEVDRLRAENAALRAVTEWAKDAPHHDWCDARFNDPPPRRLDAGRPSYPCKCGRDALAALEADR